MDDLITVIINVYNGEKFIQKCLDSVIHQTYKNLEILIINDGSTDKTLSIIKKYKDKRIRVITTKNQGLSLSRNTGIENAKGEYLYFVDVDDWIELDTIEYLYHLCKKYHVLLSSSRCIDVFDYQTEISNPKEDVLILTDEEMLKMLLLGKDRISTTWNKLMHKDLFRNIRFEDRIINDVVVTHKIIIEAKKIAYSNQIKYYYLRHRESVTYISDVYTKRSIDLYHASLERYDYIKNIFPNMIENKICLIRMLVVLFCRNDQELQVYLKKENARSYFKKIFTMKVFFCGIPRREKIKILLFLIHPGFCRFIDQKYKSMKYKYKM